MESKRDGGNGIRVDKTNDGAYTSINLKVNIYVI